jgi:hypothetical protein
MQILVFVDQLTSRVKYSLNHVLGNMLGFEVLFTQNESEFMSFKGPKISYSQNKFNESLNITPQGLLSEGKIIEQSFEIYYWNSLPIFFYSDSKNDIPFDIFSATFYLISRYEEYLPHKADDHGRFLATESIAFKYDFLNIPIVDLWVKELSALIKKYFPNAIFKTNSYRFIPTIDIDNAFAFKHKGFVHSLGGIGLSLLKLDFILAAKRIKVLLGISKDPYDSYDELFEILKDHPDSLWFILGGSKEKFDRNLSLDSYTARALIQRIAEKFNICVHPSYGSGIDINRVRSEIKMLDSIVGEPITKSRQHYLKINLPQTYRLLSKLGINTDYSMGYSSHIGFRAGTCTPYSFYDLIDEKELSLIVVPFQVMDRALLQRVNCKPSEAIEYAIEIAAKVNDVGGTFVTIWHNESLSGINEWKGWEKVFGSICAQVSNID